MIRQLFTFAAATTLFTAPPAFAQNGTGNDNRAIYVGNAIYQVNESRRYDLTAYVLMIDKVYRVDPDADPKDVYNKIQSVRTEYESDRMAANGTYDLNSPAGDAVSSVLKIASLKYPIASGGLVLWTEANHWAGAAAQHYLDQNVRYTAERYLGFENNRLAEKQQRAWGDAYDLARSNPKARQVLEAVAGAPLNASVDDNAKDILRKNPKFSTALTITQSLSSDGTLVRDIADVRKAVQALSSRVNEGLKNTAEDVSKLDATTKAVQNAEQREAEFRDALARARDRVDQTALDLQATEVGGAVLSQIVSASGNKNLARDISVTVDTYVRIGRAFNTYSADVTRAAEAAHRGADFDELAGTAGSVMMGNIVLAGFGAAQMFSKKESPDQAILEAIAKLSKQLEDVRQQMHQRFDRIDASLYNISGNVIAGFNAVSVQLGKIQGDTNAALAQLSALHDIENASQKEIYEFLRSGFDNYYDDKLRSCLDFKRRSAEFLAYAEYDSCVSSILQNATVTSAQPLSAGTWDPSAPPEQITLILGRAPAVNNINLLAGYARDRLGLQIEDRSLLSNPVIWWISAKAYVSLANDWPNHLLRQPSAENGDFDPLYSINAIISAGDRTTAFLRALRYRTDNGVTVPRFSLFDQLFTEQRAAWDLVIDRAAELTDKYYRQEHGDKTTISYWGDSRQASHWESKDDTMPICKAPEPADKTHKPVHGANAFLGALPSEYRLAAELKVGDLKACYSDDKWLDDKFVDGPPQGFRYSVADLTVHMSYLQNKVEVGLATVDWRSPQRAFSNVNAPLWVPGFQSLGVGPYSAVDFFDLNSSRGGRWERQENWGDALKPSYDAPAVQTLSKVIMDALVADKPKLEAFLIDRLTKDEALLESLRVAESKTALLRAFLELALDDYAYSNDAMRSSLVGSGRILDRNELVNLLLKGVDPAKLKAISNARTDELRNLAFGALGRSSASNESGHRYLDTSMNDLRSLGDFLHHAASP